MDKVLQFKAVAVIRLTEPVGVKDHDFGTYTCNDFTNKVFAITKEGHMLYPVGVMANMLNDDGADAGPLFRDYWRTVHANVKVKTDAPYYNSLLSSKFKLLSGTLPQGHILNVV